MIKWKQQQPGTFSTMSVLKMLKLQAHLLEVVVGGWGAEAECLYDMFRCEKTVPDELSTHLKINVSKPEDRQLQAGGCCQPRPPFVRLIPDTLVGTWQPSLLMTTVWLFAKASRV